MPFGRPGVHGAAFPGHEVTHRTAAQPRNCRTHTMARSSLFSGLAASALAVSLALGPALLAAQPRAVPEAEKPAPANADKPAPAEDISAELMYRLLVGDIALQRGDPAQRRFDFRQFRHWPRRAVRMAGGRRRRRRRFGGLPNIP